MLARKPVLPVMVVCCVLVGWLVWVCVPALAAAPETPEVSVEALVPPTTAVVHGVLNPGVEGGPGTYELGTYEFLYKKGKAGCEGEGKAPASPGISLGGGKEGVSETLQGLLPDTEYTVCLLVRNGIKGEQSVSDQATFTTSSSLEAPVTTEPASAITATTATFEGELNPGGAKGRLSYQLDYNTNGTCAGGQSTAPVEVAEAKQDRVQVEAMELEPNEDYTFCLVVSNTFGEQAQGNEVTQVTGRATPAITGVSVTNVSSTEATVSAEIYPHGEMVTYQVEYGPSEAYGSSTVAASVSGQHGPAGVQARLTGLAPNGEYHYRIVASNDMGRAQSSDGTFKTGEASVAGSQGLPDNRVDEMVTPPENENADVYVPTASGYVSEDVEGIPTTRLFQVSADGSAVAYEGDATSGGGNGEAGNWIGNQFLAKRLASGWITRSIQPAGVFSTFYQGFSSDLSVGVLVSGTPAEPTNPALAEDALGEGYEVLYARGTSGSSYQPLYTNEVKPNRSAGNFGQNQGVAILSGNSTRPVFAGGSSSFSDLLFETNDALLAGSGVLETELENDVKKEIAESENGNYLNENYLYDSVSGKLSLIDVSPEGKVVPGATFGAPPLGDAGKDSPDFSGVISANGSRVYWSSIETLYGEDKPAEERSTGLFLRENPTEPQSPVVNDKCSVSGDACTVQVSGGEARYWASASNGRYALYTEGGDLYRFNAEPEPDHAATESLTGPDAGVISVLGVSEDGKSIYFVAKGVLSGPSSGGALPMEGEPNLYLLQDGTSPIFIGTLSDGDGSNVEPFSGGTKGIESGDWQPGLNTRTSRVTDDGNGLVFISSQPLSVAGYPHGYQNAGAEEVYVYEAESNSLFCASCGSAREVSSGYLPVGWNVTGLPRWISEDGDRVFFDSGSSLVSQDTNGRQDVYEWEREGSGSCTGGSGVNGGCVFLLSGGTSESGSWLIGASESGSDVFVATRAQLTPEDQNETFDLYDVRVDGVKPVSPPQCTGTGCQGVPSPPPTFATPSSVTFNGVGNFAPLATIAVKVKVKTLSRAQKLADALKVCHKKPKRKRATCEVRARKRYGPLKKTRKGSRTVVKGRK